MNWLFEVRRINFSAEVIRNKLDAAQLSKKIGGLTQAWQRVLDGDTFICESLARSLEIFLQVPVGRLDRQVTLDRRMSPHERRRVSTQIGLFGARPTVSGSRSKSL